MFQVLLVAVIAVAQADPETTPKADAPAAAAAPADGAATDAPAKGDAPAEGEATEEGAAEGEASEGENAEGEGEDSEGEEEESHSKLYEVLHSGAIGFLLDGGIFMWPLLFLLILSAGVMIERYRSLKMLRSDTGALRAEVGELLQQDRLEEAYRLCDGEQGPVPAVLAVGIRKFLVLRRLNYDPGRIEEQVVKAMDDYSVHIVAALERHLPILATISSVAPMLGFLGTVQGMIVAFQDIVEQMGETNIVEAAAAGISVALLTTCFGLIVGIPTFMAFNYFTGVINRFVLEVEESATELIEVVTLQMTLQQGAERNGESTAGHAEKPDGVKIG